MGETTRDALLQEQIIAQWHAWRRFLTMQLELLELRANPFAAPDVFEAGDTSDQREQRLLIELAAMPGAPRDLFARMVDVRREQVQATLDAQHRATSDGRSHPLDADQVDRQTYTELLHEAEGIDTGGVGLVPMEDDWYQVDAAKLDSVPDNGRYQLAGTTRISPARVGGMALMIVAGLLGIWWTLPGTNATAGTEQIPALLANGQPLTPWTPRTLILNGATSQRYTITRPDVATTNDVQHQADLPLTLCLPDTKALDGITTVELVSAVDAPVRTYTIQPTGTGDLVLRACDNPRQMVTGTLAQLAVPEALALGATATLGPDAEVTMQALTITGAAEDASLPPGRVQLNVTMQTRGLDGNQITPVVRWRDGQDILPSTTDVQSSTTHLRYLVPAFTVPTEVQVRLNQPNGVMQVWQTTIAPPPDRTTVLTEALRDITLVAEQGVATGALHLLLTLTNGGPTPLTLTAQDIIVQQGDRRSAVPSVTALAAPLQPGEQRTIDLVLFLPAGQPLSISVGGAAFQIANP